MQQLLLLNSRQCQLQDPQLQFQRNLTLLEQSFYKLVLKLILSINTFGMLLLSFSFHLLTYVFNRENEQFRELKHKLHLSFGDNIPAGVKKMEQSVRNKTASVDNWKAKALFLRAENSSLKEKLAELDEHEKLFHEVNSSFGSDWAAGLESQRQHIHDLETQVDSDGLWIAHLEKETAALRLSSNFDRDKAEWMETEIDIKKHEMWVLKVILDRERTIQRAQLEAEAERVEALHADFSYLAEAFIAEVPDLDGDPGKGIELREVMRKSP